ncbi:hypothetical protein DNTS_008401 [Danionella cerebrum]|uniref:SMB domain-containing protein n=1 Tax=Danionella cerebrum TaxID=2873325 RepID=A0A553MTP8_9TELE|nr:hypothetical protein DNTS_008401 [Danionella translucida]
MDPLREQTTAGGIKGMFVVKYSHALIVPEVASDRIMEEVTSSKQGAYTRSFSDLDHYAAGNSSKLLSKLINTASCFTKHPRCYGDLITPFKLPVGHHEKYPSRLATRMRSAPQQSRAEPRERAEQRSTAILLQLRENHERGKSGKNAIENSSDPRSYASPGELERGGGRVLGVAVGHTRAPREFLLSLAAPGSRCVSGLLCALFWRQDVFRSIISKIGGVLVRTRYSLDHEPKARVVCVLILGVCEAYVFQAGQTSGEVDEAPPQSRAGGFECSEQRCGEPRNEEHACHCSDDCLERGDCCTNYKSLCAGHSSLRLRSVPARGPPGESSWLEDSCEEIPSPECPAGAPCAVSPAQGLYPESHGIVCNSMYDPVFKAHFRLKGREKLKHHWWGGQPIWITAEKQGVKAGTFFWPWVIPLERRILTILQWLNLPDDARPYVYAAHSEQPDTYGHILGPLSNELDNTLRKIDNIIGQLMNGLKQMNLHRCVNLILVGDHGMEEAHCERTEYLASYGLDVDSISLIPGSSGRIGRKHPHSSYDPKEIVANLTCKMPNQHFSPYLKQHLPKRLHYANNRRIEDVHLLMERKWHVAISPATCGFFGDHGFDNKINSMQTIFLGFGPSFRFQAEVPVFENIELYNVMCGEEPASVLDHVPLLCCDPGAAAAVYLLGLTPAPNNGTHGSLNSVLRNPSYTPSPPQEVTSPAPLSPPAEPVGELGCSCDEEVRHALGDRSTAMRGCGSLTLLCAQNNIDEASQAFAPELDARMNNVTHLPWARPAVLFLTSFAQLCHAHFCSGFSLDVSLPLWSAFTLPAQVELSGVSSSECVRVDPRLDLTYPHSCTALGPEQELTHGFLYPPDFCVTAECRFDASLITNTVPMYRAFKKVWGYLQRVFLPRLSQDHDGLNAMVGPIFDYDHDGVRDTEEKIRENAVDSIFVPTHFYCVVMSCEEANQTLEECEDLWTSSFILPHREENREICSGSSLDLLKLHTARLRDVELLTGLDFLRSTSLEYTRVLQLKTHMQTYEDEL